VAALTSPTLAGKTWRTDFRCKHVAVCIMKGEQDFDPFISWVIVHGHTGRSHIMNEVQIRHIAYVPWYQFDCKSRKHLEGFVIPEGTAAIFGESEKCEDSESVTSQGTERQQQNPVLCYAPAPRCEGCRPGEEHCTFL
jgi:hypothetical protein